MESGARTPDETVDVWTRELAELNHRVDEMRRDFSTPLVLDTELMNQQLKLFTGRNVLVRLLKMPLSFRQPKWVVVTDAHGRLTAALRGQDRLFDDEDTRSELLLRLSKSRAERQAARQKVREAQDRLRVLGETAVSHR